MCAGLAVLDLALNGVKLVPAWAGLGGLQEDGTNAGRVFGGICKSGDGSVLGGGGTSPTSTGWVATLSPSPTSVLHRLLGFAPMKSEAQIQVAPKGVIRTTWGKGTKIPLF